MSQTTAPFEAQALVLRAKPGLGLTQSDHVATLLAAARRALLEQDGRRAWLLADRLARITSESEALPFLLLAAALAAIGEGAAANQALRRAQGRNPAHRTVAEACLHSGDAELATEAAQQLVAYEATPPVEALKALAGNGASALILPRIDQGRLAIHAFWQAESGLDLSVLDGAQRFALHIAGHATASGGFARQGTWIGDWPSESHVIRIDIETPGACVLPHTLHRPARSEKPVPSHEPGAQHPPGLMIVVPVYDDFDATEACFLSLDRAMAAHAVAGSPFPIRLVVVDDCTPDPRIAALLDHRLKEGSLVLIRHAINRGFAESVNRAFALRRAEEDIVLLNADTLVPAGLFAKLRACVHADPRIGTATPLSNNGEDVSVPRRFRVNMLPPLDEVTAIDRATGALHGLGAIDIPNGIGFCLYLRAALIDAIGGFSGAFERGYFEDVEYCLRARAAGFRNVCAVGSYVGHAGSRSFGAAKQALVRRNYARLIAEFPTYPDESAAFVARDPLGAVARTIGEAVLGACRHILLIVFAGNPDQSIVEALVRRNGAAEGACLLLHVAEDARGIHFHLDAAHDRFPGELVWSFLDVAEASAAFEDGRLPIGHGPIVFADPARLPAPLGALLAARATSVEVALLSLPSLGQPLPAWCAGAADLQATTEWLAAWLRKTHAQPVVKSLAPRALAGRWQSARRSNTLAARTPLLAIRMTGVQWVERALVQALAAALQQVGGSLAILGLVPQDLDLLRQDNIWVTGTMADDEILDWLKYAGAEGCLFADRLFGFADPLVEALAGAGVPTACFRPDSTAAPHLALKPDLPEAEAISIVADWLAALASGRVASGSLPA